jgi:hypothetical protein
VGREGRLTTIGNHKIVTFSNQIVINGGEDGRFGEWFSNVLADECDVNPQASITTGKSDAEILPTSSCYSLSHSQADEILSASKYLACCA